MDKISLLGWVKEAKWLLLVKTESFDKTDEYTSIQLLKLETTFINNAIINRTATFIQANASFCFIKF